MVQAILDMEGLTGAQMESRLIRMFPTASEGELRSAFQGAAAEARRRGDQLMQEADELENEIMRRKIGAVANDN
nr:hypothetical protein CIT39_15040 [Bradyrhizobium symbiodeficiens]